MGIRKQDYQFTTALMEVKFGEPIISYVYFTQLKSWGTAYETLSVIPCLKGIFKYFKM